jgi:hypothetical protein
VLDEHGKRLAKRHDALAIAVLRESGITPAETLSRIVTGRSWQIFCKPCPTNETQIKDQTWTAVVAGRE